MKRIQLFTLLLALVCATVTSWAQTDSVNTLSVGLNFVSHGETCGGGLPRPDEGSPAEDRSQFLFGRTRLIVDYHRPGLQAHAVVQNKAIWGMKGNQSLNLYEGWVKLAAKNGLFAQLGRVALAYDDERIIGPNDFATASMSHDVLRVGYEGHGHRLHAILAYNQNADNVYSGTYYDGGAQLYKTMQTVWYHYDLPKFPLGASLLFMNVGLQAGGYKQIKGKTVEDPDNPVATKYQQMWGGYLHFHPRYVTLEGSYYRQTGKIVNEIKYDKPIKAWMGSVKAQVHPSPFYGFEAGYDYLSGDKYFAVPPKGSFGLVQHNVIRGFNPIYGSHHKFYGAMDFFYVSTYVNGFTPGLQNTYVGASYKPFKGLSLQASYHYLAMATQLIDIEKTLGHELEIQGSYKFTKDISLSAGFSYMTGTKNMEKLRRASSDGRLRWGWISLNISPRLFTTKW